MKEHIVGFEMVGDPKGAFYKISDQTGDPNIINPVSTRGVSSWTDGEFEFKVKSHIGNKNGFGSEHITYFRAKAEDLFHHNQERVSPKTERNKGEGRGRRSGHSISYYVYKGLELKKLLLSLPLFEWNIENYSNAIKIGIEEVDGGETFKNTTTTSSEFATNFSFDVGFGEAVKVGLKYGISTKETRTIAYEVTTTKGNDELGEVIVNFADDIITNDQLKLCEYIDPEQRRSSRSPKTIKYNEPSLNRKYTTGWFRLYIAPKIAD